MAYKFNPFTGKLEEYGPILTGTGTVAAAADGTAALPGISFANDLNTGIYRPGADQVAISTGGTGRLFIDASGNVGINTSAGGASGFGAFLKLKTSSSSPGLFLENGDATNWFGVYGGTSTSDSAAIIYPSGGSLRIATSTGVGVGGFSEKIRITSAGLVGIGTSSVDALLQVEGTQAATWSTSDGGTYSTKPYPTEVAVINQQLATTNSFASIYFQGGKTTSNTGIRAARIAVLNDGTTYGSPIVFANRNASTGNMVEALRIDSSQRVGIGTTSPLTALHVNASSGIVYTTIGNGNGGTQIGADASGLSVVSAFANNAIRFGNSSGSTFAETMRLDSSGRLLVGTSTLRAVEPNGGSTSGATLTTHFEGISSLPASVGLIHNGTIAAEGSALYLARTRGTAVASSTLVALGDTLGTIAFAGGDGTDVRTKAAEIYAVVDGTPGANDMPGRIVLSTTAAGASSPTPRMVVSSTGTTGVFTTNAGSIFFDNSAGAGTTYEFLLGRYGATGLGSGTASFRVWTNGNVVNTNNSYGAISDIKLKENIVDAGSQWDDLKALQVRKYNFKEGQTHTQIGLVAQEVELVSPGLVTESPDRDEDGNDLGTVTKSVNYSVLYMKAVKALQEAMERIETLEAKVAALEAP